MTENWFTNLITNTLSAAHVYNSLGYVAGIAFVVPFVWIMTVAWRIYSEASGALTGKAALAEAVGDINRTVIAYAAYAAVGMVLFTVIFAMHSLFSIWGSQQLIHNQMIEARQVLQTSEEQVSNWLVQGLRMLANLGSMITIPIALMFYQIISLLYISLTQLISVVFAIGVVLTYLWGYVAIPTISAGKKYNLMEGWARTWLTLLIWAVLEPILLGFLWFMNQGALSWMAGSGMAGTQQAVAAWYIYACIMMLLVSIFKILAPFLAVKLASNQSMGAVLGAAPAAVGLIAGNQLMNKIMNIGGEGMGKMAPDANSETPRRRDSMAEKAGAAMGMDLLDLPRRGAQGVGDLAAGMKNKFSGSEAGPGFHGSGEKSTGGGGSVKDAGGAKDFIQVGNQPSGGGQSGTTSGGAPDGSGGGRSGVGDLTSWSENEEFAPGGDVDGPDLTDSAGEGDDTPPKPKGDQ